MDLNIGAADEAFRQEVRAFIAEALTPELRAAGLACAGIYNDYPAANAWHRILAKRGWSVPSWPVEYGGTGWTPLQHYIFDTEMIEAGAPRISSNSTRMVAPVVIAFGTEEQKARYLPAIRSGDDWWAQGYSEPGSGSDLASLQCRATRDGDSYIINGSKIWTTHAHFSNRIFCLVRTRTEGKPQAGISFLLFDIDLPGIEIRPIHSISGDHELNAVFFTDVRVPAASLLGQENDGWTVAKYLLQHERSHTWSPLMRTRLKRMRKRAAEVPSASGGRLIDDLAFAAKLAEAEADLSVFEVGEMRMLWAVSGRGPLSSNASSMNKILGTELRQRLTELAVEIEGPAAWLRWPDDSLDPGRVAMTGYLNDRAASIYAGANEVQRNIVAGGMFK